MKIFKFEIRNYRSCIHTVFNMNENLTALIGINGVGKSNILYGLQLFNKIKSNRRFFNEIAKEEFSKTQINLEIYINNRMTFVRADFYYETNERNIDVINFYEIKYRFEGSNARKWNKIIPEAYDISEFIDEKRNFQDLPKRYQNESIKFSVDLIKSLANISYYSATQFSDPSKCPVSLELSDFRISSQRRKSDVHEKFIHDLYTAKKTSLPTFNLFLNTVGESGLELIQDIKFHVHQIPSSSYKVKTGGEIQKIENFKKIIVPSIKIDGLSLSPNQLSEGTFKTLALVFYILNDSSDVLLIEEPEVSVHHGLLNSIIELVKQQSHQKQIIISTHSDYVLDMLKPNNILLVNKKENQGTKAQSLTKTLSKNEYKVLKEYLQTSGNLGEYWKEGGFDDE
ncbi:AAA family ATPase [Wenyingzhuangia sp. chi5]|uniref:AAA family ATPase n=1 Tax=Wenyingzhuangia gilva TaxID=3057677 RepID=A0ABT8VVC0_9FLAO|nr:ATP-binding protein [Wenyingzhuangia sp. chi5]MDO3695929.1 AAA family ATPase [Wenyingzhuangia sp. chi5]